MILRLDAAKAISKAMMAPEIFEAQIYFCSSQMARATDTTSSANSAQVSSAAMRLSRPNVSIK